MALSGTNYVQALTGMSDETYNTINSGFTMLASFIITMGMGNPRAWSDLRNNQNTINDILLQGKQDLVTSFTPKPTVIQSSTYKDWVTMKADHPGTVTKFVQDNKPIGSPVPRNWFDKGGSITIEELSDGTQVWRYTSAGNETVSYIGGQSALNGYVKFPQEYLHPDQSIAEFNIGHFTGDRAADKELALEYLQTCGYESIPPGYVLHHDVTDGTMQLVSEDIHSLFTHYGGVYFNK